MPRILQYGDSLRNPNLYYRTGFLVGDPVIYYADDSHETLVVSGFEKSRAEKEGKVARVLNSEDLGYGEALKRTGDRLAAEVEVMCRLVGDSSEPVQVESSFPVLFADRLREAGLTLEPNADLIRQERRTKNGCEIEAIAQAQTRAEQAITQAAEILREAVIDGDTILYCGVPLTAEFVRGELEAAFAKDNFAADSMIVAAGPGSADPHWTGKGLIRPGQPVILDVFPMDRSTRYFGDVTRSYVKGWASPELQFTFDAVRRAQQTAVDMIGPGANGRLVHEAVVQSFVDAGFGEDGPHAARYLHGTGHGVGLEVHEQPGLNRLDCELLPGDVVTVEPGLYDPEIGGIRIEDIVVVTETGGRNLNRLPRDEFVIP